MKTTFPGHGPGHAAPRGTPQITSSPARRATAALLFAACALLAPPAPAMPATGPVIPGFETYDQVIPGLLEEGHFPGAAVAVAYRGRIVFARGYGFADRDTGRPVQPDTRFRLGSVTKMFTAATILKLVEDGKISLDDPAFPLLGYATPTYPGAARDPRLDRITIRQLLSHTGGWDSYTALNPLAPDQLRFAAEQWQQDIARVMGTEAPATAETIVRFMVGQPLQFDPGTGWQYANIGFLTLGRVIEHATGLSYEAAVQQFVAGSHVTGLAVGGSRRDELEADEAVYYDYVGAPLQPLYLGAGNVQVPQPYMWSYAAYDSSGGLCLSAIEVLRFMVALDGRNGVPPLLRPETVALMRTPVPPSNWYGLGWFTTNANGTNPPSSDAGHGGNNWGTTTWALRSADGEWNIVALLNGSVNLGQTADVARVNNASSAVLHTLPDYVAHPPEHDFTWTTLGWEAWQRRHFGGGSSTALADPDGDGVPNLLEYAAGLDPTKSDVIPPAAIGRDADGTAIVTYRRLILEHPLSWTVDATSDGVSWQPLTAPPATTLNSDGTLSCSLRLPGVTRARLRVRGAGAEATLELAVPNAPGGRLVNLSSRAYVGRGENVLIAGFAIRGDQPRTVLIRGAGPALAGLGVGNTLANPQLSLYAGQRTIAASDDWGVNVTTVGDVATRLGAFAFPARSADSGLLVTLQPGNYTCALSGVSSGVGNGMIEIYEADQGTSHLVNVSARSRAGGTAGNLMVGFVVGGGSPRRVLIRACGPSLRGFGVVAALADPQLRLVRQSDGTELARNVGWTRSALSTEPDLREAMSASGAFAWASGSADSAVAVTLAPGAYTAVVDSAGGAEGVVLAEVYELP